MMMMMLSMFMVMEKVMRRQCDEVMINVMLVADVAPSTSHRLVLVVLLEFEVLRYACSSRFGDRVIHSDSVVFVFGTWGQW